MPASQNPAQPAAEPHAKGAGRPHPRIVLWPRGLIGRVVMILLASVVIVFCVNWFLYEKAEILIEDDDRIDLIAQHLETDARVLSGTPAAQRPVLAAMLSTGELRINWKPADPTETGTHIQSPALKEFRDQLTRPDSLLTARTLILFPSSRYHSDVAGILSLSDGSSLHFTLSNVLRPHLVTRGATNALVVTLAVLIVAIMLIRALTLPLRALAEVADKVGSGTWVPLSETGPREVRRLAQALNSMQERIRHLIEDRTEALAAVSHDLRTPLARLRLRAGFLQDREAQDSIEADLDEMEAMVDGVLAYLSGETTHEEARPLDLAALLSTIADDASDQGRDVVCQGPDRLQIRLPPLAMKRVFNNLVENAIWYAGSAVISLHEDDGQVVVEVTDDGPGIPEAELERVMTPFYRIEASRSRRTGGLGLGLAIVHREVERAGGVLTLQNRPEGGLCARVSFQRPERPAQS
ncbi:HAMP domain-containing protein [Acetobacter sp. AN02]|uniref:ATP-binding protein n=1 Tax=Acetobacter sp. AN02 TaxID=2894186 RepID=UPI00243422C7|nr:ATP-binding protein [Acetobacter sp. AN02]MDG6094488.1 HAMP domain-containing protein [Acetobacter sp. AN02]